VSSDVWALFDLGWKLLLVLGLAVLSARVLRWLSGPSLAPASLLRVLARLPLGPQQSIVLIAVGKKRLLVGQTPQRLTLLAELDDEDLAGEDHDSLPTVGGALLRRRTLFGLLSRGGADSLLGNLGAHRRDQIAGSSDVGGSSSIAAFAAALQAASSKASAMTDVPRGLLAVAPSPFQVSLTDGGGED